LISPLCRTRPRLETIASSDELSAEAYTIQGVFIFPGILKVNIGRLDYAGERQLPDVVTDAIQSPGRGSTTSSRLPAAAAA